MEYLQGNDVTVEQQLSLTDVVTFSVRDPAGTVTVYVDGVDPEVTEASSGVFVLSLPAADVAMAGEWFWRVVGEGGDAQEAFEGDWTIIASSVVTPTADGPRPGPFTAWCEPQDVIDVCPGAAGSDTGVLDGFALTASQVLFEMSGRVWAGLSDPVTVRPLNAGGCGCWPWNETWHSWGQVQWGIGAWGFDWGLGLWGCGNQWAGCSPVSEVKLAGYPVREIVQVKVGGDIVDPSGYWLDGHRDLVRMRDVAEPNVQLWWPSCQILDLPDTEPGTFSVTYRYGADPPNAGRQAAAALACELWRATPAGGGECKLPVGVRRQTRQGNTIDISLFAQWGRDTKTGAWAVGIPAVDTFLNAYNPNGLRRRASVSSPWTRPYPIRPGL